MDITRGQNIYGLLSSVAQRSYSILLWGNRKRMLHELFMFMFIELALHVA